jgi:CheY-like chemotaxis protein
MGVGKILIVDDEKFNCDIIEGFLMILGFTQRNEMTEFAYNGEQAVKAIKQSMDEQDPFRFSLILMDCNMPFLDGYEATKRIRKLFLTLDIPRAQQPRIVAITGHVENEYVQKAISSGMDKVYPKPLPIKEFG